MQPGKLYSIQVLRAVAALIVVLSHSIRAYTINAPGYMQGLPQSWLSSPWFRDGMAVGVDIFFVISGFIMVHVSEDYAEGRKTPGNFFLQRVERIYPPYIVATLVLMGLTIAWVHSIPADFTPSRIVASMALIPSFDSAGLVQPILGVGWTLSYEMYFYLAFAAALAIGRRQYLPVLMGTIIAVWFIATIISSRSAVGIFFSSPIVFEFLFGCLVARLYNTGKLPSLPLYSLVPAVAIMAVASYFHEADTLSEAWRFAYWGIPAAIVVATVLPLQVRGSIGEALRFLGDASYSIYLIHVVIIYNVLARFYPKLISYGLVRFIDQAVAMTFIVAVAGGVMFHLIVERPFNDWRKRSRKRAAANRIGAQGAASATDVPTPSD
ncbi:peptidoglycan/LPS O-acetylase OafA/YrhL [Rhizobium sp. BK529]|uniref:acyltransferase family protein n=1 Tax=Rhizobium sp. BK529 TaxID=2586983 RepID=UPI00161E41FE|nr:acyltransferase [Rhizobium sp. BK529]MBB3590671.1 peptidoglycan/LPS O-acetylase OafA/YrhL [Rhizobium sp. BK529]